MKKLIAAFGVLAAGAANAQDVNTSSIGVGAATEIAKSAQDPNNADGLVPAEVEDWVERVLSDSALGPYIRQALNAMEKPLQGPYQWQGYLPCEAADAGCGNNLLRLATRSNISDAACIAYDQLALVGYILNPPPHGSSGCIKPYFPPGVKAYTFDGYQKCSGGFFCFGGWTPLLDGPLSYAECFAMQWASGWRPAPQLSGPQPPLGVCIPPME